MMPMLFAPLYPNDLGIENDRIHQAVAGQSDWLVPAFHVERRVIGSLVGGWDFFLI